MKRASTILVGTVFFGVVAAIHGITGTAATSMVFLGVLWVFFPAPLVFLARMQRRWTRFRTVSTAYLVTCAVLSALVLMGVSWIGSERGIHPSPCDEVPRLDEFPNLQTDLDEVDFQSQDGIALKGWFIPGDSPRTVVLLHGYGCQKEEMLPHADLLHMAGFSVFLFDFRNRGESAGDAVTLGYLERGDVKGAVEYLKTRRDVNAANLGVLGISMGGATAILAAAETPELAAVISESGFRSADSAIAQSFEHFIDLPAFPFSPITVFIIERRLGIDTGQIVPEKVVGSISPRPVFIIHGQDDEVILPKDARALHAAAGEPKEDLWMISGAEHAEGVDVVTVEYAERVVGFFDKYLRP